MEEHGSPVDHITIMGWGDTILAAGQAQRLYDEAPDLGPITLLDGAGAIRWQPIWLNNPAIRQPRSAPPPMVRTLRTGHGYLPYLNYPYSGETGWTFSPTWKASDHRGKIYLTPEEIVLGVTVSDSFGPYILLEPSGMDRKNRNRCWPSDHWWQLSAVLRSLAPLNVVQLDHPAVDALPNVPRIAHDGFRQACGVLASATLFVGPEGGLAHAAAALGIPSVILWGGCISCDVLGYPEHVNLVFDHPQTPCGSPKPCDHCQLAWSTLSVPYVVEQVMGVLSRMILPLVATVQ